MLLRLTLDANAKCPRWKRTVAVLLLKMHVRRLLTSPGRGAVALLSYAYLALRVCVGGLRQAALQLLQQVGVARPRTT